MRRSPTIPQFEPTEAEIQQEAYFLWSDSGCVADRDLENWLMARELLRRRHGRTGRVVYRRAIRPASLSAQVPNIQPTHP